MNLNNNSILSPNEGEEKPLNPLKPIIERINTLEGITKNYQDSFETKQLTVTEGANISDLTSTDSTIENLTATEGNIVTLKSNNVTTSDLTSTDSTIKNLEVTENAKIDNLATDTPIISNAVVGYDNEGKMIPIRIVAPTESSLYFDYTVDSQKKFDDLISILTSITPNTYKSIAIVGGYGDGKHGEYLYTVDSNIGEANLNNASLIGFNSPKIVITTDDADTLNVFKNGVIKDIDFNVGGTVLTNKTVTLFHNCTYDNGKITLNNVSANFNIVNTTLSNVVNDECKSFSGCTLNNCTNNECKSFSGCTLNNCTNNTETTFTSCNFTDGLVNKICTFTSCNLNNILINYACTFTSSTLKDCKNTKYSTFTNCTLNDCETIQSVFTNCSSEMLYVKTDSNIASKYSFNKCGIHLDMKKTDMTKLETVTINISSLVNTSLTVLDKSSNLKKIILNVNNSDVLSSVVGNNGKDYSIYHGYFEQIRKSISPSMRDKAYICVMDTSFTPVFSKNGTDFYIDEKMKIPVYVYAININGTASFGFTTDTDSAVLNNHYYKDLSFNDLSFNKSIETPTVLIKLDFNVYVFKIPNYANEYILNGKSIKEYHVKGESSNTIIYSSDNGGKFRLNPELLDTDGNVIGFYTARDSNSNTIKVYGFMKNYSAMLDNLYFYSLNNKYANVDGGFTTFTPDLLEITPSKDNYNVQVVSNYNAKLNVENAFFTKVNNN